MNAVYASIQTLPPELINEILAFILPRYPERSPLAGPDSPLALAQICAHWRRALFSLPERWAAFCVVLHRKDNVENKVALAELYVARSQSHPLSLRLQSRRVLPAPILLLLDAVAPRLEHVVLLYPLHQLRMLKPLPALKTLSIQSLAQYGLFHMHHQFNINGNTGVTYYDLSETLTMAFRDASALRKIHIRFYVDGYSRLLPLAQLTHATIDDLDVWQFSQLLRHTSNLVYCRVVLRADSFSNPNRTYQTSPSRLLRLPHLETLVMLDNPEWHAVDLERYTGPLVLPSLKSLRLSWLHLDGNWPLESLARLLERSQCELHQLTLNRWPQARSDSQEMLQLYRDALPQVQSIVLADGESVDDSHIFSDSAEDDYESDDTLGGLPDEDEDL